MTANRFSFLILLVSGKTVMGRQQWLHLSPRLSACKHQIRGNFLTIFISHSALHNVQQKLKNYLTSEDVFTFCFQSHTNRRKQTASKLQLLMLKWARTSCNSICHSCFPSLSTIVSGKYLQKRPHRGMKALSSNLSCRGKVYCYCPNERTSNF